MNKEQNQSLDSAGIIQNIEGGEIIYFINPNDFRFVIKEGVDYSPRIETLIRVMDTPVEDIYHYRIVHKLPPIVHKRVFGIEQ